ncbi:MAG: tetratricopeptide repeat protein [Thermodesulfovibrionales bacterium]
MDKLNNCLLWIMISFSFFIGCNAGVSIKSQTENLQDIEDAYLNERWDELIAHGERQLSAEPENPVVHFVLSMAYYMKGDYELQENHRSIAMDDEKNMKVVISWCEQFADRFPDNYYARLLLASAYRTGDDLDKTIRSYQKAIEINPSLPDAYVGLAVGYFAEEKIDEAIKNLKKAIELNPNYVPAFYNLGFMYEFNGQNDEAIVMYERTIELKPDFKEVYINLGDIYMEKGEKDKALEVYQRLIEIDPDGDLSRYAKDVIEGIK